MAARHGQATTPEEAFWTLDPFAVVKPGHDWFVNLEAILPREHYGVSRKLRRHLGPSAQRPDFVHIGLMGHAGTGKTTLTRSALAELAGDGLTPVFIDALQAFDNTDFRFSDAVLVLVEAVVSHLHHHQVELDPDLAKTVRNWFAEELILESHKRDIEGSLETSATAHSMIPLLATFSAKIKGALKSNNEYRTEIRRRAERDPAELIRRTNLLLDGAHAALPQRKLVVVFDNLEKMPPELVDQAIIQRADELRRLRANVLFFFNPASEYAPSTVHASSAFTCINVPVMPVRFPGDAEDVVRDEARKAIEQLLSRRLLLDRVFEDPRAAIDRLAQVSGGHLRHIFQIARRAVEDTEPDPVTMTALEKAARWWGNRMTSSLQPDDFPRAVTIHRTHKILDTPQDRRMLRMSCVLAYDGEGWWDMHPGIRADPLFQAALEKADEERGA